MNEHRKKGFIESCASHTMHRFSRQLKSKISFQTSEIKTFAICYFSLLLNCADLSAFDLVLNKIFIVFLSDKKTVEYYDARETLQSLIEIRPKLNEKVEESIRGCINSSKFNKSFTSKEPEGIFILTFSPSHFFY